MCAHGEVINTYSLVEKLKMEKGRIKLNQRLLSSGLQRRIVW
jgi:hypothetical protein